MMSRRLLLLVILALTAVPTYAALPPDGIQLLIAKGPAAGQFTLTWNTGPFTFSVYRSVFAPTVTDPGNLLATTSSHTIADTPPAGQIFFYKVTSPCTTFSPPEVCDGVDNDCDGTSDGTPADAACAAPHSTSACVAGTCVIASCRPGYENCDFIQSTGCEAHPADEVENCGSCGHLCPESVCDRFVTCLAGECIPVGGTAELACGRGNTTVDCWNKTFVTGASATPTAITSDTGQVSDATAVMYVAYGNTIFSLDPNGGVPHWQQAVSGVVMGSPTPALLASCESKVFVASSDGHLYRFDSQLLGLDWTADARRSTCTTDELVGSPLVQIRSLSNPAYQGVVPDDLVIVATSDGCGDLTRNRVVAYRGADGALEWEFNADRALSLGPANSGCSLDYAANRIYCGTALPDGRFQNTLWSISTLDGSLVWSANVGSVTTRPQIVNGRLYVATGEGTLLALDPTDGSVFWRFPVSSSAILHPPWVEYRSLHFGLILVTDGAGTLHAVLDRGTRAIQPWVATPPGALFTSSPVVHDAFGKIFVGRSDGKVAQLETVSGYAGAFRTTGTTGTVATPLLEGLPSLSDPNALTFAGANGSNLVVKQFGVPWGIPSFESWFGACSIPVDCVGAFPFSACSVPDCRIDPVATSGFCIEWPLANGTACNDGLACTTSSACDGGMCLSANYAGCACSLVGDRACVAGLECCGAAAGCVDLSSSSANCGGCGHACLPDQVCEAGVCARDDAAVCPGGSPSASLLNSLVTSLAGSTALAYADATCNAVLSGTTSTLGAGKIYRVTPLGTVVTTAVPGASASPENGVAVSPNGNFLFGGIANEILGDPLINPGLHVVDLFRSTNVMPLNATRTYGSLPFVTNEYNQGPVGPTLDLKTFNGTNGSPLRLYQANWFANGDVVKLNGSFAAGAYTWSATSPAIFSNHGIRITALAYGTRPDTPPTGVVWTGYGSRVTVFCTTDTNGGAACPAGYPKTLDLASSDVFGGVQRIYSLAADPLYGDVYAVVKNAAGVQQLLLIRGDDLSVRALNNVQLDWRIPATPLTFTDERRGALAWSRFVTMRPPTTIGSRPVFFETGSLP